MGLLPRGRVAGDTNIRWLGVLLISVLLHSFLTPWATLLGLVSWERPPVSDEPTESLRAIPVDIVAARDAQIPTEERSREPLPPKQVETDEQAASPPDEPSREPIRQKKSPESKVEPEPDAPVETPPVPPASEAIGDPVQLSGSAGQVADANANVRLMLRMDRIRKHPLGPKVGRILRSLYQWRDFLGPTQIDPVRDIDTVLIAGPQLRDSSEVAIVLQYNVEDSKVEEAISMLMAQGTPPGRWLATRNGVKMGRVRLDRAARVVAFPAPHLLVIVPPQLAEQTAKLDPKTHFPPSDGAELMSAYIATPWRALLGLPLHIPKSIKWARLRVLADQHGATLHVDAAEESPATAAASAKYLTRAVLAATHLNLGFFERRFIKSAEFHAEGKLIRGKVELTLRQLSSLVRMAQAWLDARQTAAERQRNRAEKQRKVHSQSKGGRLSGEQRRPRVPPATSSDSERVQIPKAPSVPQASSGAPRKVAPRAESLPAENAIDESLNASDNR